MSDWPKDDKLMSFWELTRPVVDLVRQAYSLRRKSAIKEGLSWDGPSLPESLAATCFPFDERVSAQHLQYDDEEQGRDPLTVIIGIAVQLGIEQGRRIVLGEVRREQELENLLARVAERIAEITPAKPQ